MKRDLTSGSQIRSQYVGNSEDQFDYAAIIQQLKSGPAPVDIEEVQDDRDSRFSSQKYQTGDTLLGIGFSRQKDLKRSESNEMMILNDNINLDSETISISKQAQASHNALKMAAGSGQMSHALLNEKYLQGSPDSPNNKSSRNYKN